MIDLHIHSTCSDGSLSPKEIIDKAKLNKVTHIAIADHDSIFAYNDKLFAYAKLNNITLIPAVEISTRFFGVGFHILGYNFDLKNKQLMHCLLKLQNSRTNYLINVCEKLQAIGYHINIKDFEKFQIVTKAHISNNIINNSKNNQLLTKVFGHIPSQGEFIETIMNEGCPAFVEKFSISPIDACNIIKQANGKAFLAHPVCYVHEDNVSIEQISNLINLMNLDGIEANYIYINKNNQIINQSDFWNAFAEQKKLSTSIGSDYHKTDNIHPEIGFVNTDFKLNKNQINKILNDLI